MDVLVELRFADAHHQDAYWTTGRSVLLGGASSLHPSRKHIAIDGRVRSVPSADRVFALYWAISRTQVAAASTAFLRAL